MAREIEIKIGDTVSIATLLDEKAPKTCEAIWDILPIENEAHSAKIAGLEIYFMAVPRIIIEEMENPIKVHDVPPGIISYYPTRPYIQIFLGHLLPAWNLDVNAFASITENLEGVKEAADRAWRESGEKIVVSRK
jgi:hypothetical protein